MNLPNPNAWIYGAGMNSFYFFRENQAKRSNQGKPDWVFHSHSVTACPCSAAQAQLLVITWTVIFWASRQHNQTHRLLEEDTN